MISKKDVLGIVAEKHGLIIGDDDPILSVLSVSDAIYDIYTARLSEQMENLTAKNIKLFSQKTSALQSAAIQSTRQIADENRRGLSQVLEHSKADWQSAFANSKEKNLSVLSEFKKIRNQLLLGLGALTAAVTLLSIVVWIRGV